MLLLFRIIYYFMMFVTEAMNKIIVKDLRKEFSAPPTKKEKYNLVRKFQEYVAILLTVGVISMFAFMSIKYAPIIVHRPYELIEGTVKAFSLNEDEYRNIYGDCLPYDLLIEDNRTHEIIEVEDVLSDFMQNDIQVRVHVFEDVGMRTLESVVASINRKPTSIYQKYYASHLLDRIMLLLIIVLNVLRQIKLRRREKEYLVQRKSAYAFYGMSLCGVVVYILIMIVNAFVYINHNWGGIAAVGIFIFYNVSDALYVSVTGEDWEVDAKKNPVKQRWKQKVKAYGKGTRWKRFKLWDGDSKTQSLKKIAQHPTLPQKGDVFIISPKEYVYFYGVVLNTEDVKTSWTEEGIVLLVLRQKAWGLNKEVDTLELFNPLIEPVIINPDVWNCGWFYHTGVNISIPEQLSYGFYRKSTKTYVNEYKEELKEEPEFLGEYKTLVLPDDFAYLVLRELIISE